MLPSADQLFKDADLIFQQDLAPAHTAKSTKSWLNDHGVGVRDWPANSPDLRIYGVLSRDKQKTRDQKMPQKKIYSYGGLMNYSDLLRLNWVNWWVFVKCEPKSSQLKEPKT